MGRKVLPIIIACALLVGASSTYFARANVFRFLDLYFVGQLCLWTIAPGLLIWYLAFFILHSGISVPLWLRVVNSMVCVALLGGVALSNQWDWLGQALLHSFGVWAPVPPLLIGLFISLLLIGAVRPGVWARASLRVIVCVCCLALVGCLAAYIQRGYFDHSFFFGLLTVVPAFVLWLAIWAIVVPVALALRRANWLRIWRDGSICLVLMLGVVLANAASYFLSGPLAEQDIIAAKEFCERTLLPRLNAYHAAKGSYPSSIEQVITRHDRLPWVMRDPKKWRYACYEDGKQFSICISDPRDFLGWNGWAMTSEDPNWRRYD